MFIASLSKGFQSFNSILCLDQLYLFYQQQIPSQDLFTIQLLSTSSSTNTNLTSDSSSEQESIISSTSSSNSIPSSSSSMTNNLTKIQKKEEKIKNKINSSKKGFAPSLSDCCKFLLHKPLRKEDQVNF